MSSNSIQIGSIVYGAAGVGCRVLAIEGDRLTIQTTKGEGAISVSRVVKVENKPIKPRNWKNGSTCYRSGDRVRYIGSNLALFGESGTVLEVILSGYRCEFNGKIFTA